ncbi:uncharacterized protein [Clytia hemisphaerica]|uniref:uncharacterized protein isoform X2 n=1 Tax=Clytia hemisphaerica TaxID=252671 RepID=UPI0034D4B8C5
MIENDPSEHLTLPKPPKPAQSHHNNRPLHKNNNAEDENDPELQVIREFLNTANLDSSGFIDETELAAVVDLSPDEIRQIFWTLDNDGDGKISIEQFTHYYKTLQEKQDVNENELPPADNAKPMPAHHQDMTRDSFRDSGYSMSEPTHRKKKHPTTLSPKTQKDAAKYLGQEYLDDLYEVARSRDDPLLLESLENFLSATVDNLLKKQADNERLDAALKHAKDQNTEIAAQIEDEMEEQVAIMEEKIRQEEEQKLTQQKQEAHAQLQKANDELGDMEHKIIALEEKLNEQKIKEASIPDHFIDKIQRKEQENQQLQAKLLEFHTQMSLMRTEVAALKSEYDEQSSRLHNERGTVLSCVREQENLTRQLQMLHEANKRLHDTNDDLRSALDVKRSNSFMNESSISPLKRSQSFAHQQNPLFKHDLQSSFRSDPGYARHHSTLNNTDFNDTDDDSRQSFSRDDDVIDDLIDNDDVINQQSLMAELMSAEDQAFDHPPRRRTGSALSNLSGSNLSNISEREQFAQQLEMLAETNRRLGESNDDLRNALSLLTDHVRSQSVSERSEGPLSRRDGSERSDILTSRRESPPGCYSTPSTPLKSEYTERPRPNSTSSPRKVILTKSGYHSQSDTSTAEDTTTNVVSNDDQTLAQTKETSSFCTTCDGDTKSGLTNCPTCGEGDAPEDTAHILENVSWDETPPFSLRPDTPISGRDRKNSVLSNQSNQSPSTSKIPTPRSMNSPRFRSGTLKSSPRTPLRSGRSSLQNSPRVEDPLKPFGSGSSKSSPRTPLRSGRSSLKNSPRIEDPIRAIRENNLESGLRPLLQEEDLIEPSEIALDESSAPETTTDDFFRKLEDIPPSVCETCDQTIQVDFTGTEQCQCTLNERDRLLDTLLTDSDSDDSYTEQETSHLGIRHRVQKPPLSSDNQYDDTTNDFTTDPTATQNMTEDMSKSSAFGYPYDRQKPSPVSKRLRLLHNLESEMSMLSTSEISEDELENSDNDSVDDEELIRLVDQAANEETGSITDEPITVEEKILDVETVPRGPGVGADTSSESGASVGDVSSEPDEMFKLVLAGNAAVGKSSFILRLCKNKFYSALNATLGVDFQMKRMIVDKKKIALQCWDTAGQERFRSIAKSYFRRVDGVVLLYDVTCENSFLDVREWIESIESSSDNVPVILCGNKVDLRPDAERIGMPVISRDQGQQLAKDVGALFIETSAKEGTNIHRACKDLIRMMQRNENPKPHPNGTVQLDPESEKPKKAGCCGKS